MRSIRAEFEAFREETNLERARDRKRIKALEVQEPTKKQTDRREILRGLLIVNNGKMFASDARKRMNMDEASFSRLIAKMGETIEVKKSKVNKRKNLLVLRSEKG